MRVCTTSIVRIGTRLRRGRRASLTYLGPLPRPQSWEPLLPHAQAATQQPQNGSMLRASTLRRSESLTVPFPPPRQRDRQRSGDSPFPSIPALKPKKQARWTWPPKKGTVGAELDGAWGHKMDTELGKDAPPMESQDGSEGRARDSLLLGSQGQEKQHACLG